MTAAPRDCYCLQGSFHYADIRERGLGVDRHHGEAALLTCKKCGRLWLRYFYEIEAIPRSGRWFCGLVREGDAARITVEKARAYLGRLDWYYCGGSYFGGRVSRSSGKILL